VTVKEILSLFRFSLAGLRVLVAMTLLVGAAYPLVVLGVSQVAFPWQANGSLVTETGEHTEDPGDAVGSALLGQTVDDDGLFLPRPSAAGEGYDASASSGTNLGPTSAKLAERLKTDGDAMRQATGAAILPADAITTSGSGLDPDVSPAFAELQVARIAQARGVQADAVRGIIAANTTGRTLAVLGEPRVNVLAVNLALDAAAPAAGTPTASAATPAN
jgi:potassium-transporting ATPase KdpC subunit